MRIAAIATTACLAGVLLAQSAGQRTVGPLPSGGYLLNTGWRLSPVGEHIPVGTFPMSSVVSKDGKFLVVLNAGWEPPSLSVVDLASRKEISRTTLRDGWLGLTFNPKGDRLYVGGGAQAAVYEFTFQSGVLISGRTFYLVDEVKRSPRDFAGDVCFSPDGRLLYVADLFRDSVAIINPLSGVIIQRIRTGRRPYRILFSPDGKSFFITSWADGTLTQYQYSDGSSIGSVHLGAHLTDIVLRHSEAGDVLYLAAANTNFVYSVLSRPGSEMVQAETANISFRAGQPLGMTPSSLALSEDGKLLHVVCSDANSVAEVDLAGERPVVTGFIPVGWYPTGVINVGGGKMAVLNGRGTPGDPKQGSAQTGSVSILAVPSPAELAADTDTAHANASYGGVQESSPGVPSGIKHAILVMVDGPAYDQIPGGFPSGNGSAESAVSGPKVTPNFHKLASEFVLLDNFWAQGESVADGINWATAAIAPDFVQKLWPNYIRNKRSLDLFEGGDPTALPPAGYLWDNAIQAGLSIRNYGFWVQNEVRPSSDGTQIHRVLDPQLTASTDMEFRGPDESYPDSSRAEEFITELHEFEQTGKYPNIVFLRLGSSVSSPATLVNTDQALGKIVEAVSNSKFWSATAIFVTQVAATDGPNHVNPRRAANLVISPYVRRHVVENSMYNTVSILRTVELTFGLRPMTQFDAGAHSLVNVFQERSDLSPFRPVAATADSQGRNK